jgi:hypothetical protein
LSHILFSTCQGGSQIQQSNDMPSNTVDAVSPLHQAVCTTARAAAIQAKNGLRNCHLVPPPIARPGTFQVVYQRRIALSDSTQELAEVLPRPAAKVTCIYGLQQCQCKF